MAGRRRNLVHVRLAARPASAVAALALSLVASTLLGIPGAPAAAVAPSPKPECVDVADDAQTADKTAAACGKPVEILDLRDEVSQTFANGDGTRTREESIEPVRVRKGDKWGPVDTVLKVTPEGVQPRAAVLPVTFSPGGSGPLATVRDGARELSMSWPGKLPAPTLDGSSATYPEVLPGVDLKVTATSLGFREVLVVKTRQAAADPKLKSVRFGLSTKGVKVAATGDGGLSAVDSGGDVVFSAPTPLMWDSSVDNEASTPTSEDGATGPGSHGGTPTEPAKPTREQAAPKTRANKDVAPERARRAVMPVKVDATSLTVTPDPLMMADPATELPIFIDPSWTGNISGGAWTSVWSKYKTSAFYKNTSALTNGSSKGSAGAGRTEDCSGCSDHIIRSFFRMDTSAVRGKRIISAQFRVEQKWAWTCSPKSNAKLWLTGGISTSTTWNRQPTWDGSYTAQALGNRKYGAVHGCLGPGTIEFNVTNMVARAAGASWTTLTVGLRAIDEGTLNQWKRFNHASPKLSITYNTKPSPPANRLNDGRACGTGAARPYVLTTTPILAVKHADPDTSQQSLTTWFYWWQLGGARNETDKMSQASGNPSAVTKAIPTGKLVDGGTYVWQARTTDGTDYGDWSGTCEFTVDATPPPTPGAVTSTQYPAGGTPSGGVGLNGTFAIAPPPTRPHEVKEYAYTLDSAVLAGAPTVPARTTDYGASITLAPKHDGSNTLRVWAKDHAGRFSATPSVHTFTVRAGVGPAGEWTFDEASGNATDVSNHGNTLVPTAGATRVGGRSGIGSALNLNGTNGAANFTGALTAPHPDTGVSTPVRTDASFTVSARVRLTTTTGVTGQQTAVAAVGGRMFAYTLSYSGPDNRWRFAMAGTDADNPALYSVLSNAAPTAGKWTHLAATYDGGTKKLTLYVNGIAQTATATLVGGFNATTGFSVGKRKWNGGDDGFLNGAVDDVRFYSFVETPTKIAELALPLPAALTFPAGSSVSTGTSLQLALTAGGDTNVTKYRYSIDTPSLGTEVNAPSPGAAITVGVNVGTQAGTRPVYVAAVDDGGRVSRTTQAEFTVTSAISIAGTVIDGVNFMPVQDATVTLTPGSIAPRTTGADGGFSFAGFAAGTYTLSAVKSGPCGFAGSIDVEINGPAVRQDLIVWPVNDDLGYTCNEATTAFAAGTTTLPLTGDNAVGQVSLPFAFPFYGQAYRSAWVDTNGVVSFDNPGGSFPGPGGAIPAPVNPNALVAPFWDDLVVDASSSVLTGTTGTGPGQRYIIEWRNVHRKASTTERLSFEVLLAPDGTIAFNYTGLDNDAEKGANAVVGIESSDGEDGLVYAAGGPLLETNKSIVFDHPGAGNPLALYDLSGTLVNAAGTAVVGATVTLDPSGLTTTTGAGGAWRFDDLVSDSYTVSSKLAGRCGASVNAQVELAADTVRNLQLGPDHGGLGYACATGTAAFVAATTVLPLTGDDAHTSVSLPFPMTVHGRSYSTAIVSTNGFVNFGTAADDDDTWANPSMPNWMDPNAVVAPYWDDLEVDASASIRTQSQGAAPNRSYVVEWRNMRMRPSGERVTFELIMHEDGRIVFQYGTLSNPIQQGAGTTVGIENVSGTVAAQYSFQEAVLTSNLAITYTPAAAGTISGVLTTAVTGAPVGGKTVTLSPNGLTTTTAADGSYQFTGVKVGEYTVSASTGNASCAGQHAREIVNHPGGISDVDLSVMTDGDEFGYKCDAGAKTFVPGDITEGWTGDDTVWQKNPPFPVKLYGESYTSAWISANGLISFRDPAYFGWIGNYPTPIPSESAEGVPNATVYVHWDNWVVDSSARIATKVSGTAPNRQWVVEWRNVHLIGDTSSRATFEAIFNENGDITLAYADIDPAKPLERGQGATVGIENGSGAIAYQYLHRETLLASGQGVTFRPNPPGTGSISGTVTCAGTAVSGATVAVAGLTATTAANGTYTLSNVPAGSYAVVATQSGGVCTGSSVTQVVVGTNTASTATFATIATPADSGYSIVEQPVTYTPADTTVLPITGDEAYTSVAMPFPVTLYGQSYTTGYVQTNGLVSFVDPGETSPDAWPIPSVVAPEEPNAAIYPLWHDWVVDSSASVRTATRGTAPNRQFVVEWRNVHSYEDPLTRISFQAIFDEAGGYSFAYTGSDGTFLERGGAATIGIENAAGTVALQYTYRQPVLRPGLGLRINKP